MKIARAQIRTAGESEIAYGIIGKDKAFLPISNSLDELIEFLTSNGNGSLKSRNLKPIPPQKYTLKSPVEPSKVIAVGLNYKDHAHEFGSEIPEEPILFLKPSSAVIGPEEEIIIPFQSKRVDYEAELAVVISQRCKMVTPREAKDYILGYTCGNDVTEREFQKKDGQWTRAKGFDTFCPLGPWIVPDINPTALSIECYLDGVIKQKSNTANMIWNPYELVSFVSGIMTLYPGDVILTGTPSGVGPMEPGQTVSVKIEGIGVLRNQVRHED